MNLRSDILAEAPGIVARAKAKGLIGCWPAATAWGFANGLLSIKPVITTYPNHGQRHVSRQGIASDIILAAVTKHFGVTLEDIRTIRRDHKHDKACFIAVYLLSDLGGLTYDEVAKLVSRNRSNIFKLILRAPVRMAKDPSIVGHISTLTSELQGGPTPPGGGTTRAASGLDASEASTPSTSVPSVASCSNSSEL